MKRNLILCVVIIGTLLISAVGCQRDSAVLPSDAASDLSSQADSLPTSSLDDASTAESTLDSESASKAPVSSQTSSSPAPVSTPAEGKESSIPSPSSSEPPVSYTYSDKVVEQMKEVDPANPPEIIWVFLTPAASDRQKTYDSSFFPEIDVTVRGKQYQGGLPTYDMITSERTDVPLEVLLTLGINEPGWENFQKVVSVLDQRDDISVISFECIGVYDM